MTFQIRAIVQINLKAFNMLIMFLAMMPPMFQTIDHQSFFLALVSRELPYTTLNCFCFTSKMPNGTKIPFASMS